MIIFSISSFAKKIVIIDTGVNGHHKNIKKYPNFKSFLWSLESRDIKGRNYGVLGNVEFFELQKIVNMFLKLAYWG